MHALRTCVNHMCLMPPPCSVLPGHCCGPVVPQDPTLCHTAVEDLCVPWVGRSPFMLVCGCRCAHAPTPVRVWGRVAGLPAEACHVRVSWCRPHQRCVRGTAAGVGWVMPVLHAEPHTCAVMLSWMAGCLRWACLRACRGAQRLWRPATATPATWSCCPLGEGRVLCCCAHVPEGHMVRATACLCLVGGLCTAACCQPVSVLLAAHCCSLCSVCVACMSAKRPALWKGGTGVSPGCGGCGRNVGAWTLVGAARLSSVMEGTGGSMYHGLFVSVSQTGIKPLACMETLVGIPLLRARAAASHPSLASSMRRTTTAWWRTCA